MLERVAIALMVLLPILPIAGLLAWAEWWDRRRAALVAQQISLTDAISAELGWRGAGGEAWAGGSVAGRHDAADGTAGSGRKSARDHAPRVAGTLRDPAGAEGGAEGLAATFGRADSRTAG
jgi:hypothetical protein